MKHLYLTTLSEFRDFLEKEIKEGRNPTNKEEWEDFFKRFYSKGKATYAGSVFDNFNIKSALKKEGLNVKSISEISDEKDTKS